MRLCLRKTNFKKILRKSSYVTVYEYGKRLIFVTWLLYRPNPQICLTKKLFHCCCCFFNKDYFVVEKYYGTHGEKMKEERERGRSKSYRIILSRKIAGKESGRGLEKLESHQ